MKSSEMRLLLKKAHIPPPSYARVELNQDQFGPKLYNGLPHMTVIAVKVPVRLHPQSSDGRRFGVIGMTPGKRGSGNDFFEHH